MRQKGHSCLQNASWSFQQVTLNVVEVRQGINEWSSQIDQQRQRIFNKKMGHHGHHEGWAV